MQSLLDDVVAFNRTSCALSNFPDEHQLSKEYMQTILRDIAAAWQEFSLSANRLLLAKETDAKPAILWRPLPRLRGRFREGGIPNNAVRYPLPNPPPRAGRELHRRATSSIAGSRAYRRERGHDGIRRRLCDLQHERDPEPEGEGFPLMIVDGGRQPPALADHRGPLGQAGVRLCQSMPA